MKPGKTLSIVAAGLSLATSLHAHRLEGLLQSSLVEVVPTQIKVQVTLVPGIDVAPRIKALLDPDADGEFSESESKAWAGQFMARQSVVVDGQTLPLTVQNVRSSPLPELSGGHADIVIDYTADLGKLAHGPRTVVCANRYEPIPCIYQCNGLVPMTPGVRIHSHRRDEGDRELTLAVEFSEAPAPATPTAPAQPKMSQKPSVNAFSWLIGLSGAGATVTALAGRRSRTARGQLPEPV
jgi:hypothetical protein